MADALANFANSLVATAPSPATSGTSLVVTAGQGALFPVAPFNATIAPANAGATLANSEIVRVTAVSTDTLTITRAQEASSARTVVVGDRIYAGLTRKTYDDLVATDAILSSTVDNKMPYTLAGNPGVPGFYVPQVANYTMAATALISDQLYCVRVLPQRAYTITLIAIVVQAFSASNDAAEAGIFTASGTTMTKVASSGSVTGKLNTSNGVKTFSVSASLIAGTEYYIGFSATSTASLIQASTVSSLAAQLFGTSLGVIELVAKAATAPGWGSTITTVNAGLSTCPFMAVRES